MAASIDRFNLLYFPSAGYKNLNQCRQMQCNAFALFSLFSQFYNSVNNMRIIHKKKKKKNLNSNYLIMIAQNYFKLKQMTYLRQNLHDQLKILEKYAFSRSSIISLANAKSLCKIHFGHKTRLFVHRFSKFLQVLLGQTKIKILTLK